MTRRFPTLLLALCALAAHAQPAAPTSSSPAPIFLGQSVVALNGPWKFTTGDSPIDPKTGQPLWAEPAFDDSQWEQVDLKPPTGNFDPAEPDSPPLPGWRAKGHPTYWGWAWYRLRVPLAENSPNLALAGPARDVGGDFFQIVQHPTDGSTLIVAGDVVGKGLKAGMLAALLVGAIRTATDTSLDPAYVLGVLNKRLTRRGDAQATCLALSIAKDGQATLANAGHMAPYLNGEPLPMEGALPLGLIESAEPSVMQFQLKLGDKLMLMSDGIAEAMDADGQLFGFDRVNQLLRTVTIAAEVANAAQSFGQEDDISVISVTRTPLIDPAVA